MKVNFENGKFTTDNERLIELMMAQPIYLASSEDGWISVDEKLPPENEPVLVYHSGEYPYYFGNMQTAYWRNENWDDENEPIIAEWHNADSIMFDVTHWTPLPTKP